MAKGLFAVYRDDASGLAPPPAASTSRGASTNTLLAAAAAAPQRRQIDGLGQREKENVDPSSRIRKGALLGKGKAVLGKSAKSFGGSTGVPPPIRRGLGAAAPQAQKATKRTTTTSSPNGICTGTLRTRVLPDLPPLPLPAAAANSTPASPATVSSARPSIRRKPSVAAELSLPHPGSAESSPRSSCDQSYASATDSGYAHSPGALPPVHQNDGEQVEFKNNLEARTEGMFADEMDSDMSLASAEEHEEEEVAALFDANRRARALTESPLAEVTQAFTGLGRFSVANMSPSPAVHHHHSAAAPFSHQPSLLSHPTSPTRQHLSLAAMSGDTARSGGTGLQTFTGTTKRLKPGQTVPSAPKAAPGRTMRL